ncbi:MAG: hypothetical protein H0W08_09885 [Acidobacteria bacterium]|nr:hypothetical protein [Acidobacteriota bacterium]
MTLADPPLRAILDDRGVFRRHAAAVLFLVVWTCAVAPGVIAVRDLTGPYDLDGFRDVAIAQAIRDGGSPFADPLYRGHSAWYPPLVPALTALVSLVTGAGVPASHVQAGSWFNALAPLAFFWCARTLVGVWPALAAACAFLLLPGRPPAWASATYSPWLFPAIFAQSGIYLGLAFWASTLERPTPSRIVFAGVILGLTLLAHSGGAALLAGTMMATSWFACWGNARISHRIATVAVPPVVALLVCLPFLAPLATQYSFHVLNRLPATWIDEARQPLAALGGLARPGAWLQLALVAVGLWWIRARVRPMAKVVLTAWFLVAMSLYAYSVLTQSRQWPALMPAYHFYFLLRAWKWLAFGCGVVAATEMAVARWNARGKRRIQKDTAQAVVVILFVAAVYPRYLGREAFREAPRIARQISLADERRLHDWIREHTHLDAVFLADDIDALTLVGPSGRAVVSVPPAFSNPYVDHRMRATARDRMVNALENGDVELLQALVGQFGVTHVLARNRTIDYLRQQTALVHEVSSAGSVVVFELRRRGAEAKPRS